MRNAWWARPFTVALDAIVPGACHLQHITKETPITTIGDLNCTITGLRDGPLWMAR